jgi:hypothetical protein
VETIQFMEVLNLKDSVEKDSFFRRLSGLSEQLPRQIVTKKVVSRSLSDSLVSGFWSWLDSASLQFDTKLVWETLLVNPVRTALT